MSDNGIYLGLERNESAPAGEDAPPASESPSGLSATGKKGTFPVMEVFGPTLQGEGQMIGYQTMFVRSGGSDYRCRMGDSLQAFQPKKERKMPDGSHLTRYLK